MRNSVYPIVLVASLTLPSCTTVMDNLPGVYSIDVQQGNIINQDMIDQLRPKMTKRQVLYIMGSSMLIDVFHQKRWDYLYSTQLGGESRRQKRLSLFFDKDLLIGVQGDFRPSTLPVIRQSNETTIELPKRDTNDTLWGSLTRLFSDETAPVLADTTETKLNEPLTQESVEPISPVLEATEEESITATVTEQAPVDNQNIETQETEFIEPNNETEQEIQNSNISITPLEENTLQRAEEIIDESESLN